MLLSCYQLPCHIYKLIITVEKVLVREGDRVTVEMRVAILDSAEL